MKLRFKPLLLTIFAFLAAFLVGCGDEKTPIKGYISEERINEIVSEYETVSKYAKYSIKGNINYFEIEEAMVERTVNKNNLTLTDSLEQFDEKKGASYYLNVPLHITTTNWVSEAINSQGLSLSTRYQLESKLYRPAGLDEIYYYETEDGGFIIRVFGANKALTIKNPTVITCRAKWNIEIEYDKDGYLVREEFATVNSDRAKDSDCCYGQATYTFSN